MKFALLLLLLSFNSFADEVILIADKSKAILSVVDKKTNKVLYSENALFGKVIGNNLNMSNYDKPGAFDYITPAGEFKIKKIFSWRLNSDILVFIEGKNSLAAIHPLWLGNKDQKRAERLNGNNPKQRRITGGCINVNPKFFNSVLSKFPDGTVLKILPE